MAERNGSHSSLALHDAGSQINGATNSSVSWLHRGWTSSVTRIVSMDCAWPNRLVVVGNVDANLIKNPAEGRVWPVSKGVT